MNIDSWDDPPSPLDGWCCSRCHQEQGALSIMSVVDDLPVCPGCLTDDDEEDEYVD